MKLATCLASSAFLAYFAGLDFATASPPRTGIVQVDPELALLKRGATIYWDPADAYTNYRGQRDRRNHWQRVCDAALTQAGCSVGVIHKGETKAVRNGQETSYVAVEGAPSMDMMENPKKMRVFHDGSTEDVKFWNRLDRKAIAHGKRRRKSWYKRKSPPRPWNPEAHLIWDPPNAYQGSPHKRWQWERVCDQVLTSAGCRVGSIHQGQAKLMRDGKNKPYIMVEGMDTTENTKKMRVFSDGSMEALENWSVREERRMADAKRHSADQPQRDQKALVFWDPADTYKTQPKRKLLWEDLCDQAFTREGCDGGIIHRGESQVIRPGGKRAFYVMVDAAPSAKLGMENGKKMRVFQDGSSEDGWSAMDEKHVGENKRSFSRMTKPWQASEGPKALLSWDPANAYEKHTKKKLSWERTCHEALSREGCAVGKIHAGESKLMRNGEQTAYIRVEAAPSGGMDFGRKLRVFKDGSLEDVTEGGWSTLDRKIMAEAKHLLASKRPMGPVEASTSTQRSGEEPSPEENQGSSKRPRFGARS